MLEYKLEMFNPIRIRSLLSLERPQDDLRLKNMLSWLMKLKRSSFCEMLLDLNVVMGLEKRAIRV